MIGFPMSVYTENAMTDTIIKVGEHRRALSIADARVEYSTSPPF